MYRPIRIILSLATLVACGKDSHVPSSTETTSGTMQAMAWTEFYGIEVQVPADASMNIVDGVLPGPGGLGGSPVGERPIVTLSKTEPGGFYVNITKLGGPMSLEGMKSLLVANHIAAKLDGATTSVGWDLNYDMSNASDDVVISRAHVIYGEIAGGYFQCEYADVNCSDPAAAEAICRSMRSSTNK